MSTLVFRGDYRINGAEKPMLTANIGFKIVFDEI